MNFSPSKDSAKNAQKIQKMRLRASCNLLKSAVKKDGHVPGKAQTRSILETLSIAGLISEGTSGLTESNWKRWFRGETSIRGKNLQEMSLIFSTLTNSREHYFLDFVQNGLVSKLGARIRSEDKEAEMAKRIRSYEPAASLHTLFDAIDITYLQDRIHGVDSSVIQAAAVHRLNTWIHERWNPYTGSLYLEANDKQKRCLADTPFTGSNNRNWIPKTILNQVRDQSSPDWSISGISLDVSPEHTHKTLLAVALDEGFLSRPKVLEEWVFDAASAFVLLFLRTWPNRHVVYLKPYPEESYFLSIYDQLLFTADPIEGDESALDLVIQNVFRNSDIKIPSTFAAARHCIQEKFHTMDIEIGTVREAVLAVWERDPIIFRGGDLTT